MATSFIFGGKKIKLPGAYSRIVSGRNNPPLNLDFGKVLIVDIDNFIPGGSGISGTHYSGKDAIYTFDSLPEFRDFAFSGVWHKAAEYLFNPLTGAAGASQISVVRPYTTVPATLTFTAVGGGANGGVFKVKTLDEGSASNGTLDATFLKSGYAFKIEQGTVNTAKWTYNLYRGTYRGDVSDLIAPEVPFDETSLASSLANPQLILQSPEFNNIQTLLDWANSDEGFAKYLSLDSTSAVAGTGAVVIGDVPAGFTVATGSTATAVAGDIEKVMDAIQDINFNFIIAWDSVDSPETSAEIQKLIVFAKSQSEYNPQLHVTDAIGDEDSLSGGVITAGFMDSDRVVYTFGTIKKRSQLSPTKMVKLHPIFHLAYHVGRLAGLPPQVPITYKALGIDGLGLKLTKKEQEQALDAGILATVYDELVGQYVVLQGVNTLQENDFTLNADGTSHVIQFRRIAAQLNAELKTNARKTLLANPAGVNKNTLSNTEVKNFTEGYLQRKIATDLEDNLILSFRNVTVTSQEDAKFVTYEFESNSEIRAIFFTGFAL